MNVWKVASRWSDTGTEQSSILNIFRKYGIVFAGRDTDKIQKSVKLGDIVAISDGLKIVSIAKAISLPTSITSFEIQEEDQQRFEYENWVIGFRVEIFDLNCEDVFTITRGRTFQAMNKEAETVKKLYNDRLSTNKKFQIKSYTYNLFDIDSSTVSLIQKELKYLVPIYQRPYSWNESQIETFLNDIFLSFWGAEKKSESESMFIGTMQLSEKKCPEKNSYYQEIIDGQQRITTLTLLIKVLSEIYIDNEKLKSFDFKWIDTDVNRGQQSKALKEVLFENKFENELNKYTENYNLLKKYFELNILVDKEDDEQEFKEDDFITHLLTNLYFVVIETKAGLSKTLQIFNAINTTGLDLDNTDIFKIRLYEYLSNSGDSKEIFENIDKLYERIDIYNSNANKKITDMTGILSIYKSYLISKYELNMTLWRMATGAFFEQLFDSLLNIKQWNGFSELKTVDNPLKIEDINKILEVRYIWESKHYGVSGNFDDFNTMLSLRLLWWSRYSNYWNLPFLYLLRDDATDEKYNQLIQSLSRLYISYTLMYQKQTIEMHYFTKKIFQDLVQGVKNINEVIHEVNQKHFLQKEIIEEKISGDIFWNPKIKNILTRMSASIEENKSKKTIKEIEKLIFDTKIDVEHIKSRNDSDFESDDVKDDWKNTLNTIGNLMILEYSINRSIGNDPYSKKMISYKKSIFFIVRDFTTLYPSWELNLAEVRKIKEIAKITRFLYPVGKYI
ncbi:DUF262 domain-containing protein [Sulfurimonas sp. SAG-AH-194-C21]|nr:DUF262 domain-containing HNH endonuclease family protein [Sulfurimonas sp. SAG-AH-194-C21]MDF1883687.1 DUF262 domain-containing protein [Sulfurimonas sp. SAG-AH-194-C21]